jgi:hypothetical protein
MKSFIQQEYKNVLKQKFVYPIRLYFQVLGFLLVSQCLYSLVDSFLRLGELQITWRADWVYNASFLLWVLYLITIITVGKTSASSGKNC